MSIYNLQIVVIVFRYLDTNMNFNFSISFIGNNRSSCLELIKFREAEIKSLVFDETSDDLGDVH